ncbi:hypothetical protein KIM372_04030 [Bombiscardovia nodaiensis]|uniref:Uncharacterized protein n=1 Tax=Bombiscardovia nodaiensis TaxID=2932181 RepID=A0ABN6S8G0_9BIFI|nr:hypothetical protein KIM372_04030 [Bombiscardovia nodaiensis]
MSQTTTVSFRTDKRVKEEAKELFADLGLDLSTALNMFLRQALIDDGLPFQVTRDSPDNIAARRQADRGEGKRFSSSTDLMKDLLGAEDSISH